MTYYLLLYDVVNDYTARRASLREAHLQLAQAAHERGDLLLAGAMGDPIEGAALVFTAEDCTVAERFAAEDPYVREGLVTAWRVRPWNVVIGGD